MNRFSLSLALFLAALSFNPMGRAYAADAAAPGPTDVSVFGVALRSTDLDRSIKFYTQGLGLELAYKLTPESTEALLAMPHAKGPPIVLLFKKNDPANSGPVVLGNGYGRTILNVPNAQALWARLKAAGYTPTEIKDEHENTVKVFYATDPDGYRFEITQMKPWTR